MKNISSLLIVFFLVIACAGTTQSTYRINFQAENNNYLLKAKPLKNGDCLIASYEAASPDNNLLVLSRINRAGKVSWSYKYPVPAGPFTIDFCATNDNGFVALARIDSANKDGIALLIFKCDRNGQLQWQKKIWPESKSAIYPEYIIQTKDGGYYFICIYNDITYLTKLDINGNSVWHTAFDPDNSDWYIIEALSESENGEALVVVSNESCEFYCRFFSLYKFSATGEPGEVLNFSFEFDDYLDNSYVSYLDQDEAGKFNIVFNGSMYGSAPQNYYFLTIPNNQVQVNALTMRNNVFGLQYMLRKNKIKLKADKSFYNDYYYLNNDLSIISTYNYYENNDTTYIRTEKYDSLGRKCRNYAFPVFDSNVSTTNITFTRTSFERKQAVVFLYDEGNLLPPAPVNYAHVICRGNASLQLVKPETAVENNTAISLYPNPAHNYINVDIQAAESIALLQILKPDGTILKRMALSYTGESLKKINISDLPKGIYFLKLNTGKEQHMFKFLKE